MNQINPWRKRGFALGDSTQVPGQADDATSHPYRPGYELVAEQLLNYIAQENLRPGDRLPTEQGLAQILGASRNVTREAVKVLAAIGGSMCGEAPASSSPPRSAGYWTTNSRTSGRPAWKTSACSWTTAR